MVTRILVFVFIFVISVTGLTQDTATPDEEALQFMDPYTQSDLNVLTGNVQRPNGVVWYEDKLYAVCNGDWTLYELEDTSGTTRTYIYGVRNGHSLYVEPNEDDGITFWIPDFDTNSILRVNNARAPEIIASEVDAPWGIAYLDETQFLVTSLSMNSILLINREGDVRELTNEMRAPTGIAVDDEYVYVANNGSARRSIEWFEVDPLLEEEGNSTPQSLVSGLQSTTGIVMGADDMLYFTYALGTRGVVGRVDPAVCREQENGCSNDQVEIVVYTELAAPLAGLTLSDDMRLFIHTIFRPEIYWVSLET